MSTETESLITKKDAARILKISLRHLDNLTRGRAIEFIKIGRAVRFSPDAVTRFRQSRTVKATA